jgi:hypothetical protein
MFKVKIRQGSGLEKKIDLINNFIRKNHNKKKVARLCVTVMVKGSDGAVEYKEFWIGKEMSLSGGAKVVSRVRKKT